MYRFHCLGNKVFETVYHPHVLKGDEEEPKEKAHKTTLVNCPPLVTIYFMKESLMLTKAAQK